MKDPCIVDADIDAAKLLFDPCKHAHHLVVFSKVTLDGSQFTPLTLKLIRQGLGIVCREKKFKLFSQ